MTWPVLIPATKILPRQENLRAVQYTLNCERLNQNGEEKAPFATISRQFYAMYQLQVSSDGAYCDALEASAKWIMMAYAQDTNERPLSLPASSSQVKSEEYETGSTDDDSPPSLSSMSMSSDDISASDSNSDDGDDNDDDIDSEIAFLQKKQMLLTRAISVMKREEIYDASTALEIVKQTSSVEPVKESSIWKEAKQLLEKISATDKESEKVPTDDETCYDRQPKRPRIDISTVTRVSAKSQVPSMKLGHQYSYKVEEIQKETDVHEPSSNQRLTEDEGENYNSTFLSILG